MEQKERSWVQTIIIAVPLTVAIVLAVLMAYVELTNFDALIHGLEIFGKKLTKVIKEYLDLVGRLFIEYSVRVG